MEAIDRLSLARRTLAQAEETVGLRAASAPCGGQGREFSGQWPMPGDFEHFFPRGLSPGMSIGVSGSRIVTLMLAAIASSAGAWTIFLGCAGTGWGLARTLGVDLERCVCLPRVPEGAASQVLAAAVDGFDVVVVGVGIRLDGRGRRLLVKRALSRGCLLVGEGWDVRERISGRFAGAEGLNGGAGHIRAIHVELSRPGMRATTFVVDAEGWRAAQSQSRPPALAAVPGIARPSLLGGWPATPGDFAALGPGSATGQRPPGLFEAEDLPGADAGSKAQVLQEVQEAAPASAGRATPALRVVGS